MKPMEGKPISDDEFDVLQVRLLVDACRDNDLRNFDLSVTLLKAMEAEFARRNDAGTCYGPRAFEKWLREHLLARNKRAHVLLAELEQDGTPVLKKMAKVVLRERYGEDESIELSRQAVKISKYALAVSVAIPLFIELRKPLWEWFSVIFSCSAK
jgi:hypothetical protein